MGLILGVAGCVSFDHLWTVTSQTYPRAHECGECHKDITHEWEASDHAHAYTNPHFAEATYQYTFTDCLGCHAPEPWLTKQEPALRKIDVQEGVTCVACHLKDGVLTGPIEPTGKVKPHPVAVNPEYFQSSALCGRCHHGTLAQWESVSNSQTQTCQACHMPGVTRKMTQASGGFSNVIVAMEHAMPQKRHTFEILDPNAADAPVSGSITAEPEGVTLTLNNLLPHTLPTGDYGYRVVVLTVSGVAEDGRIDSLETFELAPEAKTAIAPLGSQTWNIPVQKRYTALRVHLSRHSYQDQPVLTLWQKDMPITP